MPYGNEERHLGQEAGLRLWEGPEDFTGRFRVVWSSETNMLYFLVEIIDDVFVDGYVYNQNPSQGGGYPNYDIVEVFIDEDRSGGLHVFDGTGNVGNQWGTNAENAFSYHLAANAPDDGEVQTSFHALDIAGTNWGWPNQRIADYAGHFPEFALRKDGDTYTWEFSLRVHDDTYDHNNQEASVVGLKSGKVMGLSLAYCDNDEPNRTPLRRNHFFGSAEVPLSAHNDHWKNADWFGVARLVEEPAASTGMLPADGTRIRNAIHDQILICDIFSPYSGLINVQVINMLGETIYRKTVSKESQMLQKRIQLSGFPHGIYVLDVVQGNARTTRKFGYF